MRQPTPRYRRTYRSTRTQAHHDPFEASGEEVRALTDALERRSAEAEHRRNLTTAVLELRAVVYLQAFAVASIVLKEIGVFAYIGIDDSQAMRKAFTAMVEQIGWQPLAAIAVMICVGIGLWRGDIEFEWSSARP